MPVLQEEVLQLAGARRPPERAQGGEEPREAAEGDGRVCRGRPAWRAAGFRRRQTTGRGEDMVGPLHMVRRQLLEEEEHGRRRFVSATVICRIDRSFSVFSPAA